jgi:hypothetical protein
MAGVADVEGEGQRQIRCTLAGLGDHGRVGVDPDAASIRTCPLGEAARLVAEPASHVQDVVPFPDRPSIEHQLLDLPDQGVYVLAIQPAEDGLGVTGLTGRLETLMQAAHGVPRGR